MANIMLGYPNRVDAATLSGSGWSGAALSNLQTRVYAETAQSTDATTANTQFQADLGAQYPTRLVALANHNFTPAATWRVRSSNSAGVFTSPVYDSGWVNVYDVAPFGTYPFGDPSWFTGQITAERAALYPKIVWMVIPAALLARYWLIEINDTANAAGFVSIGRAFFCEAFQPTYNASYGIEFGNKTDTQVAKSRGGVKFFDEFPISRTVRFALNFLTAPEAFKAGFDLVRRSNISKEVFFLFDPTDTTYKVEKSFPGSLSALPSFLQPDPARHTVAFEIEELI